MNLIQVGIIFVESLKCLRNKRNGRGKEKKRGRPFKAVDVKATQRVGIRLTEQDIVALKRICALTGMNKTEFFRSCIKDKIYDIEFEYYNFGYKDFNSDDESDDEDGYFDDSGLEKD